MRLTDHDLRTLARFLRPLYSSTSLDDLIDRTLAGITTLVPADLVSYNELNPKRRRVVYRESPAGAGTFPGSSAILGAHIAEHPLVRLRQAGGNTGPSKLSDVVTRRELHRLALYNEYYRKIDTEYQMAFTLPAPSSLVVAVALNRRCRDFSERDRLVLDLLRPRLSQAYRTAEVFTSLTQAWEAAHRGLVVLDAQARVVFATKRAEAWLCAYFGRAAARRLPPPLDAWVHRSLRAFDGLAAPPELRPLTVDREGRRLVARLVLGTATLTLLLEEHRPVLAPDEVRDRLGLSPREAEVLVWVARGKTNEVIAEILGASVRTIEKHLERVFSKLGVETRTAAAAQAFAAGEPDTA